MIICTVKSWNIRRAKELTENVITRKEDLTYERIKELDPDWIFFPHWSWKIPDEIIRDYRCVIFHTSPLPWGRGGSPIQNQILRGRYNSEVCALLATSELDAGPVYLRKKISLAYGSIESLLIKISDIVFDMIPKIMGGIEPVPQTGEVVKFTRLKDSCLPPYLSPRGVYDFIRMLDGEGYPPAYIQGDGYRMEFTKASFHDTEVRANVRITREE
jgi:methionyl-tRNA formyltransferase